MALTYSQKHVLGTPAPAFDLKGISPKGEEEKGYALSSFTYADALLVVFMCNHCPYVKAIQRRLVELGHQLAMRNTAMVAINSNDTWRYPEDGFDKMKLVAKQWEYPFPYLLDDTQEVAKAYGAVCTPDFFLYHREQGEFVLRYQGRMDDSWQDEMKVSSQDLLNALDTLKTGGNISEDAMKPSMGCSIKWKT